MTPEQLKAYKDLGYDAIRCAKVYAMPPGGKVTSVTVPKNRKVYVRFVDCDPQTVEVGETMEATERPAETMAPKPTIQ
jgi:hypothetical protein